LPSSVHFDVPKRLQSCEDLVASPRPDLLSHEFIAGRWKGAHSHGCGTGEGNSTVVADSGTER
jgi:hypothetical protein